MNQQIQVRSDSLPQASTDVTFFKELNRALLDTAPVADSVARATFATESISGEQLTMLNRSAQTMSSVLTSVLSALSLDDNKMTGVEALREKSRRFVQETAAVTAAHLASVAGEYLSREVSFPRQSSGNTFVVSGDGVPNYLGHRSSVFATEAFDNRETRSAVLYTMAYNYSVARQGDFGETLWPTLTLPADQVGFGIVVNRLTIHRGVTHTVDGKPVDFGKVDLMRAEADHTILRKERTSVYPIFRPAASEKFVSNTIVANYDITVEGEVRRTAPLRVGEEIGIIGLNSTDAKLEGGAPNQTDTLDPAIDLKNVYIKVGDNVIRLKTLGLPSSNFTYSPQGIDRVKMLSLDTKSPRINKNTLNVDGSPLVDALAAVVTRNLTIGVSLKMAGSANTEVGTVQVFGNKVAAVRVLDSDMKVLPATDVDVDAILTAFRTATIEGYDVRAWVTNVNMRERGDFIDRTSFTQLYDVPLLSPVTAQRPQSTDGQMDAGDFEALVTTTRFRLKNDAVTAVFDAVEGLRNHTHSGDPLELPEGLGASRFHVRPTFFEPAAIDATTIVDSWSSANRLADLQAAIVNILRDYAFRMHVESEYPAAASALGQAEVPTIIVATDPIIRRYILADGDLRTLTDKFNMKIVDTLDRRFSGKVFMTFGVFDENRNTAPNILNWGNLIWAPEVVHHASVPRGESMSRETIVQPRYRFVNHLPIATLLTFNNVPNVLRKLNINFHEVP